MQRSRLIFLAGMITIITAGAIAYGQQPPASPPGIASVTFADGKTVTIDYSRPSMRGRKIFGGLVPYGEVWRTGANAATSLKTDVDLIIGGAAVPAGSYTLYTIPNENGWKLIINKQTGQWGTAYDEKQDLARVDMKVAKNAAPTEQFTILLDKSGASAATLKLDWAGTTASVAVAEKK
jgi:Protein of unknown function (DUF2911)